jgi:hypothetical protein
MMLEVTVLISLFLVVVRLGHKDIKALQGHKVTKVIKVQQVQEYKVSKVLLERKAHKDIKVTQA